MLPCFRSANGPEFLESNRFIDLSLTGVRGRKTRHRERLELGNQMLRLLLSYGLTWYWYFLLPSFTHSLKRKKGEKETEENKGQVDNEKEGGRERRGLMNIHCLGPFCSVLPSTHRFFLFSSFSKSLGLYLAVTSPNPPSFFLFNFNLSLLKLKTRHHHHRFGLNFSFFFLIFIFKTKLFFQKKTQRGNYLCSNQILLVSPLTMFIN